MFLGLLGSRITFKAAALEYIKHSSSLMGKTNIYSGNCRIVVSVLGLERLFSYKCFLLNVYPGDQLPLHLWPEFNFLSTGEVVAKEVVKQICPFYFF